MLVFKDITDEKLVLNYIYQKNLTDKVNSDGMYFGAFEDELLFGMCEAYMSSKGVTIGFVHVLPEYQNQGMEDTLLKSLFNKLELRGIKYVYSILKSELLDQLGFKDNEDGYKCDIEAMFSKGCSCCGSDHHES
jgi:N-acetylglutamate synthase-like GNAT family acetyltransferase